ncbi:leucine-rich repeat-containing G-protein coupled receptor 4-like [Leptopilina heterotoma]|uniref:leucine-rich repeat-containing G-protein coupled receptor 4-like n=1 Tax=Leptopilina heterotoma TaxID=63436 RepID=UPI001CA95916|nr:leucine-rich repeat-containing G-protein coupled receptor 4-like [Leptopilina heterotoma]
MVHLKLFGAVITFLCFFKIGSNHPTYLSSDYKELLDKLEFDSFHMKKDFRKESKLFKESLTMSGCKQRHPESAFLDISQQENFLNVTLNPNIKCLEFESNDPGISNTTFSNLLDLDYLNLTRKQALQDLNNFSHLNIKYLVLDNMDDTLYYKDYKYANWNEKVIQDWSKFNTSLDENLWESFKKSETYRKKYEAGISGTSGTSENNSIDNIINLQLPNLRILCLHRVIFNQNNTNLVINTTSTNLTHLFLLRTDNIIDFNHHFVNLKNLTYLILFNANLTSYKSSPNHKSIITLNLSDNFFLGLHNDSLDFQHHPNLENLVISYCHIYRFPKNTLKFNKKLRYLYLARNSLSVLYNDTFKANSALEVLNLNWNKFTEVPNLQIESLEKLYLVQEIELLEEGEFLEGLITIKGCKARHPESIFLEFSQENKFSSDNITTNSQVKCLLLQTNEINESSNLSFSSLPNLEYLGLILMRTLEKVNNCSHPNIKYLFLNGIEDLLHNSELKIEERLEIEQRSNIEESEKIIQDWSEFDSSLDENQWDSFKKSETYRKNLEKLYMTNNMIAELKEDSFSGLDNLQILFLDSNGIQYVHRKTFASLSNLQVLDISYNKLNKFVYQVPSNLKYLNLESNGDLSKNDVIADWGNQTLKNNIIVDF